MRIALIGNPNSGKTTLFNILTGSRAKVGNWAGVTVEKKEGSFTYNNENIGITDLPGIYSLTAFSEDELVARDYLFTSDYDLILNIIDVTNLERNLYLTTQLLELGVPVVLAINMMDSLDSQGGSLDVATLSKRFDVPMVAISAGKSVGIDELKKVTFETYEDREFVAPRTVLDDPKLNEPINKLTNMLVDDNFERPLFTAIKYLDNDKKIVETLDKISPSYEKVVDRSKNEYDVIIADNRYRYIESALKNIYTHANIEHEESISDKIDKVVLNKYLGIPLFFLVMFGVFSITFGEVGGFLLGLTEEFVDVYLTGFVSSILQSLNAGELATSLLLDGVIPGVGMMLTFLPQILLLFLFLTILEDVGYMSRATFLMDHFLRKIGLSGKAFVPMVMGFGCSVPAIMATRTLENKRDRRLAIILTPFMSCGARLPVYVVFVNVFFSSHQNLVIFSLYILGIIVAIISGLLLKNTVLKGDDSSYIMEIAPYRAPVFRNVALSLWDKAKGYVQRAGTLLLAASIIIWFLQSFDSSMQLVNDNTNSIFADIGRFIAPIFAPLGFGTWEASVSLLTGLIAKEAVVSTLGILYAGEGLSLASSISAHFTPLTAISYMTFTLLYTPCIVAMATTKKEMMSNKWTAFAIGYQTLTAYVVTFIVYNIAGLFF